MDQPIPEDSTNQRGSSEDSEDKDYMPYTLKIAKSTDTSDNSCHDNATFVNEGNGNATPGSSDNSDDDLLSNAASFDYDLNNTIYSSSDKEEGNSRPPPPKLVEGASSIKWFELKRIKNDNERYMTECAYESCNLRIHASPIDEKTTFMIKTMQVRHNCQKVHKNQKATTVWVTRRFKPLIEENPDIDVKYLGREIHHIYGLVLPAYTLYRAKNRVLNVTEEDHKRPFIRLDGCYMKGKFPMVILSTVAMDANNGVFPIALCICESECNDSWGWFLDNLYRHIGMEDIRRVTFMSDRKNVVVIAIENDKEFEVKDGVTFYIVNLDSKRCDYGLWELSGILCKHALAVLTSTRQQAENFIYPYLLNDAYIKTYNNIIHPIPDQSLWPNIQANPILPPEKKRKPGRPKKNHKRALDEPCKMKRNGGVKCSSCGAWGHNKRTCTGFVTGQA
ncbi:hypothetical protein LWI28_024035 [Acer negundo]|uniref:SWIM-type domain-containing protein n=1 Tax=Acer negundo TaxID=4023 RepID=A0AAD5NM69_ACENE|nr:hypothetical protein LWI28_024035 [Acer negundo]